MMAIKRLACLLAIGTIVLLGCDFSTLAAQGTVPTQDPNLVHSIVMQTADAAGSQTAVLIPPTLTPSPTSFPSATASITPTATDTFVLPTLIRPATATDIKTGGVVTNSGNWVCQLVSKSPADGTSFPPNSLFTATWTLKNIGSRDWLHSSVDIVNVGGPRLSTSSGYNTTADVPVDSSEPVTVYMTAPAAAGTYTSDWALRNGKILFCPIHISIVVK